MTDSMLPSLAYILQHIDVSTWNINSPATPKCSKVQAAAASRDRGCCREQSRNPSKRIFWALACCKPGQAASLAVRECSATPGKQAC